MVFQGQPIVYFAPFKQSETASASINYDTAGNAYYPMCFTQSFSQPQVVAVCPKCSIIAELLLCDGVEPNSSCHDP